MKNNKSRVVIVGAGNVGSTTAYTLINQGICNEIVLLRILLSTQQLAY